jgi:hypothetical protein
LGRAAERRRTEGRVAKPGSYSTRRVASVRYATDHKEAASRSEDPRDGQDAFPGVLYRPASTMRVVRDGRPLKNTCATVQSRRCRLRPRTRLHALAKPSAGATLRIPIELRAERELSQELRCAWHTGGLHSLDIYTGAMPALPPSVESVVSEALRRVDAFYRCARAASQALHLVKP